MKKHYPKDPCRCGNREEYADRQEQFPYRQQDHHADSQEDGLYSPYHKKDRHEDRNDHCPRPHAETVTILRCGTSSGSGPLSCSGVLAPANNGGSGYASAVQATVALDTDNLRDATVKLDFSTLITYRTTDSENYLLRLVYKLSRVCGGSHVPLGTWTFERISNEFDSTPVTGEYVQQSDPFTFSFCSCDTCPGCCYYVVEIISQECFNIDFAIPTNTSLSALAVGSRYY